MVFGLVLTRVILTLYILVFPISGDDIAQRCVPADSVKLGSHSPRRCCSQRDGLTRSSEYQAIENCRMVLVEVHPDCRRGFCSEELVLEEQRPPKQKKGIMSKLKRFGGSVDTYIHNKLSSRKIIRTEDPDEDEELGQYDTVLYRPL